MDTFEWNKIIGAVLGTLLFIIVVRMVAGWIYEPAVPAKPGYIVAGVVEPSAGTTPAAPAEEPMPDWGTVLPTANVSQGQTISHKCEQCHTLNKGGPNKIGPNLWNVVDAPRGEGRGGFNFSSAMKAKGGKWTFDELFKFLKSPGAYIPGTKMTFVGLPRTSDRIDLIAYLRTNSDNPVPIPPPAPAKPAASGSTAAPAAGKADAGKTAPAPAKGK